MKIAKGARIWLTRSLRPFEFKKEYDNQLNYAHAKNLGLYVHIPFCRSICSFCPYCKVLYDEKLAQRYIKALLKEIELVGESYSRKNFSSNSFLSENSVDKSSLSENAIGKSSLSKNSIGENSLSGDSHSKSLFSKKEVTSLYFGGGSPALMADYLGEIISKLKEYFSITEGIGLELHPKDVTVETLTKVKAAGVTKISIGIQSFQKESLQALGRKEEDYKAIFAALQKVPFETVSMDLIFAIPGQTSASLKKDIDYAFGNGANHIAIYPFVDFSFANNSVPLMAEKEKRRLLDDITDYCEKSGYLRTSIWTYAKKSTQKYSSMTRDNFLGFGCSATTLLGDQFKVNTFSIEEYIKRIEDKQLPTSLTLRFSLRQRMVYYLFWTAYTTKVDPRAFKDFFGVSLQKMYGLELFLCQLLGFAKKEEGIYKMTKKGAYYFYYFEQFYTLAYIDKMWGIMREEAFPERITL